jgi:hypothetical protein
MTGRGQQTGHAAAGCDQTVCDAGTRRLREVAGDTIAVMCATCAFTAAAGVTGLRAWLQARGWLWLTRRRMRWITVASSVVAFALVSVTISG